MKLLLINPNTSPFVTDRAVEASLSVATPTTEIDGVTGTFGAPIINSKADLAIGAYSTLELAARHARGYDAVGLAVSFDCGLGAVREILDVPVVGLAEACVQKALEIGDRFAVVSFAKRTQPLYTELMQQYAKPSQLAVVNCIPGLPSEILKDPVQLKMHAELAVAETILDSDCDSVIMLATAFAGLVSELAVKKPVIDCAMALVSVLERCVSDPVFGERFKSSVFPDRKLIQGVSPELAACYDNFSDD